MERNQPKNVDINRTQNNIQIEYTALANFYGTTKSFRLTLLGLYLATIGLISGGEWPVAIPVSLLGILITITLWMFEARTRIVIHNLAKRGVEIEQVDWDFKHKDQTPFFSRQFPEYLNNYGVSFKDSGYARRAKILRVFPIRWTSHSLALDLLYLGIVLFFITSIVWDIL